MIRITLVCAGGMSTSLLSNKIRSEAAKAGVEVLVRETGAPGFAALADTTDVLLLAPQISYHLDKLKAEYEPRGIRIALVDSLDYGTMNGKNVLNVAMSLMPASPGQRTGETAQ